MKRKGEVYEEKDIADFVEDVVTTAEGMLNNGCKEPLLSPNCIKIGNEGQIVVGEWEFTHFY